MEKLIKLYSVGSIINTINGKIYPLNKDGSCSFVNGVYLEDCSDEWLSNLEWFDERVVMEVASRIK